MRREELLHYYERELHYVRRQASDFAEKYPDIAGRLLLGAGRSDDPHVERLIEAFCLIAARIHQRLEDDFSEVSDSLLEILYPHFLCPIPSMTICHLQIGPDKDCPAAGIQLPRGATMESKPADGVRCTFRTTSPLTVHPLSVEKTRIGASGDIPWMPEARSALKIELKPAATAKLAEMKLPYLRFFLDDQGTTLEQLYELFFRNAVGLQVRYGDGAPIVLDQTHIRPVGYDLDQGMLEYPAESFLGYRLLQEYFTFPDKFLFVDLAGIDRAERPEDCDRLEVSVLLNLPPNSLNFRIDPEQLRLNCVPAVNLFPHPADPIRVDRAKSEYRLVPDARSPHAYEIYSIRSVDGHTTGSDAVRRYEPIYTVRHGSSSSPAFWRMRRSETTRKNVLGTDVSIEITDGEFQRARLSDDILRISLLCTNRDLPTRVRFGDPRGDLKLRGVAEITRISCIRGPTPPRPAPIGRESRWRIVSHLALNRLSLVGDGSQGSSAALHALQEILKIYDFTDSPATRQRIAGLTGLEARPCMRRIHEVGFARGLEIELELDRLQYAGSGPLLFASVLERFLGLYASINSFTQVVAKVHAQDEVLKRWPPRAGEVQLI